MENKETILILGADGFLGSNLAKALLKEGQYKIRVLDLFHDGVSRNLESIRSNLEFYPGNFLNREDIEEALKGVDYVFHFISLTTPGSSIIDPVVDVENNTLGTIYLLEECVKAKVKKIIFASSGGAIYGNQKKKIYSESDKTNPISPYAISKLTIEKYLEYYKVQYGMDYLILRYSNPYGQGQNVMGSQGIIPIFLNLIKKEEPIPIFGDGKHIRDYIYIDDLIRATQSIFDKKTKHKIYNIGSGQGATINEVVNLIEKITGKKAEIMNFPRRQVDVKRIVLDTSLIKQVIDFKDITPLEEGIKLTWKWINRSN